MLAQALVGQSLTQLCVSVADVQLRFTDSNVTLWSPMRVSTASHAVVHPYTVDGLALLLPLLNGDVTAAGTSESGELSLTIGDTTVRCGSHPHYEAWSYNGPRDETVVCTPGGDLAIWNAHR
jgi:hypothetical protein